MPKNYRVYFIGSLIIAIVVALLAAYAYNTVAKMVPVAVAARDIRADETPTEKSVVMGNEPAGSLKPDSITNIAELKSTVAKGFIPAGTPLRKSMFQPVNGAGVAARLGAMGSNLVAVAVAPSADTTVGNTIKRGDKVIVKAAKAAAVEMISQSAEVLDLPVSSNDSKNGINAVVLAVPVTEADKIVAAKVNGFTVYCELLPITKTSDS